MATRRRSIRLSAEERDALVGLYTATRIPSDQFTQRAPELELFVRQWNELTSRLDTAEQVRHYIVTQRKRKLWVTFEGKHRRCASPKKDSLTDGQWAALEAVYDELVRSQDMGSDNVAFDPCLRAELSRQFRRRTKRVISGEILYATIMARRKRGEWPKLDSKDGGIAFSDINEVG